MAKQKVFKLFPDNTSFDFVGKRVVCAIISLALALATVGLLATWGLNYGIDFAGGTLVQIKTERVASISDIRSSLKEGGMEGLVLQQYGAPDEILLRVPGAQDTPEGSMNAAHELERKLEPLVGKVDLRRVEYVGPQVGQELRLKALYAILFSIVAILIYVAMRFEFRFAVGAVIATVHDVVLTVGMLALLQVEISMPVLAAILTIIGYSLNDTIVVFDRVRENMRRFKKMPYTEILNKSVNEMLNRTVMMSLTVVVVLVALLIWGGEVIHDFSFVMLFGVVVGTYSSIYIAAQTVLWLERFKAPVDEPGVPEQNVASR
jgi:preprotein translocase subunit SecF